MSKQRSVRDQYEATQRVYLVVAVVGTVVLTVVAICALAGI